MNSSPFHSNCPDVCGSFAAVDAAERIDHRSQLAEARRQCPSPPCPCPPVPLPPLSPCPCNPGYSSSSTISLYSGCRSTYERTNGHHGATLTPRLRASSSTC